MVQVDEVEDGGGDGGWNTMSDDRLEVHFGVSVPAIEFDTAAASEQLLPESLVGWLVGQFFAGCGNSEPRKNKKLHHLYISTLDLPPNCFPLR